jgi:hypothetical protein
MMWRLPLLPHRGTSLNRRPMSAIAGVADIRQLSNDVRFWPIADVAVVSANVRFQGAGEERTRAGRGSTSANDP